MRDSWCDQTLRTRLACLSVYAAQSGFHTRSHSNTCTEIFTMAAHLSAAAAVAAAAGCVSCR